jgi:serine protease Do
MRKIALIILLLSSFVPLDYSHAQILPDSRQQIALSFAPLVKQTAPAVVNIYTQRIVQQRVSPLFADPLFSQMFSNMLPPGFSRERMENSLGSGVIVRADGLIVTSNHVIRDADQIRVVLSDRREFDATVVTTDEHSDLAVLRVDAKGENLPYLELKDSDDAQIGDLVIAIGNPFGVGQTVTSGIISAVTHAAVGSSDLNYFIQTDAAINPGNSGGALVTMDGKLVGINAAIYSRDGGNLGIGFAVPSNMVRVVMGAGDRGKKNIVRPWTGIDGQAVTAQLAASMNMTQPSGLLVNAINAESPAAHAGVVVGDVILTVNGHAVEDPDAFHYRIATLSIGSVVELGTLHKGQKVSVRVNLIAPPEDPPAHKTVISGHNPLAGATIENVSPAVIEDLGLHDVTEGVVISDVKPNTIATGVGIQTGDIVLSINGGKMVEVNDVAEAVRLPKQAWRITIQRDGNTMTMLVGG